MRRLFLIVGAVLLGAAGFLWAYLAIDIDPDDQSPKVTVVSYNQIFEEAVRRGARKEYGILDPAGRRKVLGLIAADKSNPPAREVALFRLRDLSDRDAALAVIRRELATLSDEQFETAIGTVAAMSTPRSRAFLDSLWNRLQAAPVAHTPFADYRASTLVGRHDGNDIRFELRERSRLDADYSLSSVSEISLFLPARPDVVVGVPNIDDVLGDFNDARFARTLEGSPVPGDIWTLPLLRTIAALRTRLDETMGILAPYFSPERLFKDQFLLARYGDDYLVTCYKDKNLTVAEALMGSFAKLGRDFGISSWECEGETVRTVRNRRSGRTLSYAVVGPYFVTSTDSTLIRRSLRTYLADRQSSFAIDPGFASSYGALDQSGRSDVVYVWSNPTRLFDVIGSRDPSARHRAVVARALGKEIDDRGASVEAARLFRHMSDNIASITISGVDPVPFWRYVVSVRSLGRNAIDSLARVARTDVGRELMPYLASSIAIGYNGIEHLPQPYGFSNTSYSVVLGVPLASNVPVDFDATLRRFFTGITSLQYVAESAPGVNGSLWIAHDTTRNDTLLAGRILEPSFAVIDRRTLIMATNPDLLRRTARNLRPLMQEPPEQASASDGRVSIDSLSSNTISFVTSYLMRTDRYTPEEIRGRFVPLRKALEAVKEFTWSVGTDRGLRTGSALLSLRR